MDFSRASILWREKATTIKTQQRQSMRRNRGASAAAIEISLVVGSVSALHSLKTTRKGYERIVDSLWPALLFNVENSWWHLEWPINWKVLLSLFFSVCYLLCLQVRVGYNCCYDNPSHQRAYRDHESGLCIRALNCRGKKSYRQEKISERRKFLISFLSSIRL